MDPRLRTYALDKLPMRGSFLENEIKLRNEYVGILFQKPEILIQKVFP